MAGRTVIRVPHYLPIADPKNPPRYLIFGDVTNGRLDPFRGVEGTPALAAYAQAVLAIDAKDRIRVMRFD